MSARVQRWHPPVIALLVERVKLQVAAHGKVDWNALAATFGTTILGVRFAYERNAVGAGLAPSITTLQKQYQATLPPPETPAPPPPDNIPDEVTTTTTESGTEARSHGTRIRTIEDLLRHIDADMTRYEIDKSEATKYEMGTRGEDGQPVVTELHRVFVRLKPKAGPGTRELVQAMIDGAMAPRKSLPRPALSPNRDDLLEVWIIPEPHIGKFAWNAETGHGDYDIGIACALLRQAAADLAAKGKGRKPARRLIACIGDFFHVDGPAGHTTGGTPLDFDGRIQKMIDAGSRALFDVIETSAATAPTDVLLTPGNHDEVLTWALQRILQSHYRNDDRVSVNAEYTPRKYVQWGKVLLGFTHGDRPKPPKLPSLMAAERAKEWGETTYREIHTGHTHATAAIETIDRVVVRTCASLGAADKWHNDLGFSGAARTMEAWYYSKRGMLEAMESSSPTVTP